MANRNVKRHCTLLTTNVREMKTETTVKFLLTLARMTVIKESTSDKHWRGRREEGASFTAGGNADWYRHCRNAPEVP